MLTGEEVRFRKPDLAPRQNKQGEIRNSSTTTMREGTNDTTKHGKTVAKVIQQCRSCDVRLSFVKCFATTRMTTYLFTLDKYRLKDLTKIDETLRRTLEVALETSGVSIVAPLPDSCRIAVTVPAKEGRPVRLAGFVAAIRQGNYRIPCILGEDFMGKPVVLDLAGDCHQLISGATGSGKTTALKAILTGIVACCNPDNVKIILVDGKGVDFGVFEGSTHLACPIIREADQAIDTLQWLVAEIERRKALFRKNNVSQIWAYNELSANESEVRPEPLPAILLMIDEIQVVTRDGNGNVEGLLRQITQQGRIYGIVAVLATQRPSVDILQGSIKTNLPGRISFRLPSNVDSRVILDQAGAESLRRNGDLLAIENSLGGMTRLQAPLVTDDEVATYRGSDGESKAFIEPLIAALNDQDDSTDIAPQIGYASCGRCETTASDVTTYDVPVSKFAEVRIPLSDVEEWLAQKYADRNWTVKLVYYPFLLGHASQGWRRFRILYDVRTGNLVRSLAPLQQTDLGKFQELGDELDVFLSLLRNTRRLFKKKDGQTANLSVHSNMQMSRLVEKGLVGMGRHGPFVLKEIATRPAFKNSIGLTELPDIPSLQLTEAKLPIDKIESQIRSHLCRIWRVALEDHMYVGLPYYQTQSVEDDTLMCAAYVTRRWPRSGLACSRV